MTSDGTPRRLVRSVLDRLLGDSDGAGERPFSSGDDVVRLTQDVGRDLENLLNTRRRRTTCPPEFQELQRSLIEYGIPDFTGLNMSLPTEREQMRLSIERAIRQFEPRLTKVAVTVHGNTEMADRRLRLRIAGVLRTEPVPELVEFDSELETSTGTIGVSVP